MEKNIALLECFAASRAVFESIDIHETGGYLPSFSLLLLSLLHCCTLIYVLHSYSNNVYLLATSTLM
jgi:hypothetical protein